MPLSDRDATLSARSIISRHLEPEVEERRRIPRCNRGQPCRRPTESKTPLSDRAATLFQASTTTCSAIPITLWKIHPPASLRSDHWRGQ